MIPIISKVATIIHNETGIVLNEDKFVALESIVQSRSAAHGQSVEEYTASLPGNQQEIICIASDFTVQETSFYRNREHFTALRDHILPELCDKRRQEGNLRLDILSAGCATGEEPYTIGMILLDLLPDIDSWDINLIAVDICEDALNYARKGEYSQYKMRNIEDCYIKRYFRVSEFCGAKRFLLSEQVRSLVNFQHANLLKQPFALATMPYQDIIFCENVIIYFSEEAIGRLIKEFYALLREPGYLFLGYSETLNMIEHDFLLQWYQRAYYYVKGSIQQEKKNTAAERGKDTQEWHELVLDAYFKNDEDEIQDVMDAYRRQAAQKGRDPDEESILLLAAEFYLDRKGNMTALGFCQQAISHNPNSPKAHILAAIAYYESEMPGQAAFELDTAGFIDPDSFLVDWLRFKIEQKPAVLASARLKYEATGGFGEEPFPASEERRNRILEDIYGSVTYEHT